MDVITDLKVIYLHGEPTEEELKQMEEKDRLRIEEIERLKFEKEQKKLNHRLMLENRKVMLQIDRDRRKVLAEENKRRVKAEKKAEKEARKQIKYPDLGDQLQITVYEMKTFPYSSELFFFEQDALFHGTKALQNGSGFQIIKTQITPYGKTHKPMNSDISEICQYCFKSDKVNRDETIQNYQDIVKKNDEIAKKNRILINEYIEKLNLKINKILKEMEL